MAAKAQNTVVAIWRGPFSTEFPAEFPWVPGLTIAEIVASAHYLPADFKKRGLVTIQGHEVPRGLWHLVRPQPSKVIGVVSVTFQMPVRGGRRNGIKQIFAIVAAFALTALTQGIIGGKAFLGLKFAANSAGAKLFAAGVSVVGGLIVNALTSVPASASQQAAAEAAGPASVTGNTLQPNSPFPCVIGTRKIFPPFLSEPIVELIGQDEYVTALLALGGPHQLENVRVGSSQASELDDSDIFVQTWDGLPDSVPIDYERRYGKSFALSVEMSTHGAKADDAYLYEPPLPVYHSMSTADDPDESWLHLLIPALVKDDIPTQKLRIPFRMRMRLRGASTWRELPELHYMDCTQAQRRVQIKFIFGNDYTSDLPAPPVTRGWVEARKYNPAASNSVAWSADSYFSAGSGNDYLSSSTNTTTNLRNVLLIDDTAMIYLDSAEFEPGIYDIEIKRGMAIRNSNYTASAYTVSGSVWDLFYEPLADSFPLSHSGLVDRVNLVRLVNIKKKSPVNEKNLSLIYVRARNKQVEAISVNASGYVKDYVDGVGWTNLVTSNNPATNFRHVLTGSLNLDPLPEPLIEDETLIEWRQHCIDNDLTCDLIVEQSGIPDLLRVIGACGFASVTQSEKYGVFIDKDRSAESPCQIFTSRTISGLEVRKAFRRLPSGLRPNFKDENYDYAGRQIIVYRDDVTDTDEKTEQIDYLGIVNREKIIRRARIDLRQMMFRSSIYSFQTDAQNLVCRRGSLIGLNTDMLVKYSETARVLEVLLNVDDEITGFVLDQTIEVQNNPGMGAITSMQGVTSMGAVGAKTGIAVRKKTGDSITLELDTTSGYTDEITLLDPITADVEDYVAGNLVASGTIGKEYRRLIVTDIEPQKNLTAIINSVDEAPQIWTDI